MQFDWNKSKLGEHAQSCNVVHGDKRYFLTASATLSYDEYQAMCNGVRLHKDFFPTVVAAKNACEEWFKSQVLKEEWDAETALATHIGDCENTPPNFAMAKAILSKFVVAPLR